MPTAVVAENSDSTAYLRQNQVSSSFQSLLAEDTPVKGPKPDKIVRAVMTAYTSTADQTDDSPCITADGTNVCKRGIEDILAANWLPIGTQVKIPSLYGDRIFEVHDRMNKRYGYGRMDIWLNTTKAEARKFGVKRVDVEIYFVKKDTELAKR
jgi:3D (Asp-Asp-Asp) domain-containing protein